MVKRILSTFLLLSVGLIFSMTLPLLSLLPMMVLRKANGPILFWGGALSLAAALFFVMPPVTAVVFVMSAVMSGAYVELEEAGASYSTCVASSVLWGVLILVAGTLWGMKFYGFAPIEYFRGQIAAILSQVTLPKGVTLDQEAILKQAPSGAVIFLLLQTWFNSVLASRFEVAAPRSRREQLKNWKINDSFAWVALASAAGSFLVNEPAFVKWVATNVFNVVVLIYFFQGLAILVHFLSSKRISLFWRTLAYLMAFFQLFLFVAMVGFVDLWINFRGRMKKDKSAIA